MDFNALLNRLITLCHAPHLPESLDDWHTQTRQAWAHTTASGERALLAGALADRLGHAFAGGYGAALQRLLNTASPRLSALCVTESEGNQPRHIKTTLTLTDSGWCLQGEKAFVTLADRAEWLWVAACAGEREGRKHIKLVGIPVNLPGITLHPLPAMKFVPEIGHAKVTFDNVLISENAILPGDGYSEYVKPFRTIEDIHVCAATCGLLLGQALRHAWPHAHTEALISLAVGWHTLAQASASAPATHLALAGLMTQQTQLIDTVTPLLAQNTAFGAHWMRDLPLLKVAEKARQQRTANAWQHLIPAAKPLAPTLNSRIIDA